MEHVNQTWRACSGRGSPYGRVCIFFLFTAPPLGFLEKTSVCALEDALHRPEPREAGRPNCSSYIILSSVSVSLVSSSHFCTFPLPPVHAVYSFSLSLALPLLNNNPSVFKRVCVWRYFWPLQGHKTLSTPLPLLFLSPGCYITVSKTLWKA